MNKKLTKNKKGEHFRYALIVVFVSISVSLIAFISGNNTNKITGFAVVSPSDTAIEPILREFEDVNSLRSLAPGNYYIDGDGIIYWLDDNSKPAIAKVNSADESQKNRHIYIDDDGDIGYILS